MLALQHCCFVYAKHGGYILPAKLIGDFLFGRQWCQHIRNEVACSEDSAENMARPAINAVLAVPSGVWEPIQGFWPWI